MAAATPVVVVTEDLTVPGSMSPVRSARPHPAVHRRRGDECEAGESSVRLEARPLVAELLGELQSGTAFLGQGVQERLHEGLVEALAFGR